MGFTYVAYESLKKSIGESIETEIRSKSIHIRNVAKALKVLSEHYPQRAIQCQYLLVVISCIDKTDIKDKVCVLNAAAFFIRAQISKSYQGKVTKLFFSPENSNLFNSLTTSLNLNIENFPDSKDILDMYNALLSFMQSHVYKSSDPSKGYLDPDLQVFSEEKIRGYSVEKDIRNLIKIVADLQLELIDQSTERKSPVHSMGLLTEKATSLSAPAEPLLTCT